MRTIITSLLFAIACTSAFSQDATHRFDEYCRKTFDEWKLPKQIFMMLLPVLLCLASWWFTFTIFNLFY